MKVVISSRDAICSNLHLNFDGVAINFSNVAECKNITITKDKDNFSIDIFSLDEYLQIKDYSVNDVDSNSVCDLDIEPVCEDLLFQKLVNLRTEIAREIKLPPYIIFHDKSLLEMSEIKPLDLDSLGEISGVGKAKLEKYGIRFIDVIKKYVNGEC